MTEKSLTLVVAMGRNRAIGLNGRMPWHLPRELRHFKAVTMGFSIVMGRKTWQSIGRPLPGRQNIIVTRDRSFSAVGCDVAHSFDEALQLAHSNEVMIIGGGQLYALALPRASRIVMTVVDCEPDADTWFPEWSASDWAEVARRTETADADNPFDYDVIELRRR